jgi:hypothetical protein
MTPTKFALYDFTGTPKEFYFVDEVEVPKPGKEGGMRLKVEHGVPRSRRCCYRKGYSYGTISQLWEVVALGSCAHGIFEALNNKQVRDCEQRLRGAVQPVCSKNLSDFFFGTSAAPCSLCAADTC